MPCPHQTPNTTDLPLHRYRNLHIEGKYLIEQWLQRAIDEEKSNDGSPFEAFIFLWFSFNGFAACVTGEDRDAEMIRRMGNYPDLRQRFSRLLEADEDFRTGAAQFAELWPIFKAQDVRARGLAYSGLHSRPELIDHYLSAPHVHHQPECFEYHREQGEHVPLDWPHTLNAVYRIRCNLFHGEKSPTSEMDVRIVAAAFRVFSNFLVRSGMIEPNPRSHTVARKSAVRR